MQSAWILVFIRTMELPVLIPLFLIVQEQTGSAANHLLLQPERILGSVFFTVNALSGTAKILKSTDGTLLGHGMQVNWAYMFKYYINSRGRGCLLQVMEPEMFH